jgi:hypothetical protein
MPLVDGPQAYRFDLQTRQRLACQPAQQGRQVARRENGQLAVFAAGD